MPSSRYAPRLPPEVVDLVIDNLREDFVTLRICGLVSRDWLVTSRHHALYVPYWNIHTFLDLLNSPLNTFFFPLRGLHLLGVQQDNISQIWPLLPAFSSLRTLHLYGKQLTLGKDSVIPGHLPLLKSFGLSMAHFASYDILTTFLSQFPSLKTLKLVSVACDAGPVAIRKATLQIQLNMLSFTLYPGILGWLKAIDFSLSAPCLEVDFLEEDTDLGDYLKFHGKNLRHLTLKFRAESQLSIFSEHPVLHANDSLQSLKISHCFTISGEYRIRVAPALGRILRHLAHSRIDQLMFVTALESAGAPAPASSSSDAAELLDGIGFAGLRRIEFHGPWDSAHDILRKQFTSAILALLPLQAARGAVHIS
ncbi:hypothetical protein DFH09DRAFT_1319922 [Mycena vulgaris]|nr:hypothetical protein DFH09DRAFT_1319922 [Mycena vulgaris]